MLPSLYTHTPPLAYADEDSSLTSGAQLSLHEALESLHAVEAQIQMRDWNLCLHTQHAVCVYRDWAVFRETESLHVPQAEM